MKNDEIINCCKEVTITVAKCSNKIDFEFIALLEGFELKGYVSLLGKPNTHSGVTIASGLDLGTKDRAFLEKLGIGDKLVNQLSPYCGLKLGKAEEALRKNPLIITKEEGLLINEKVKKVYTEEIVKQYNKSKGSRDSGVEFFCLPKEAQTVIMSVYYQHGIASPTTETPNFWKHVTTQDWESAIHELRHFTKNFDYQDRREKEAKYLEGIFK